MAKQLMSSLVVRLVDGVTGPAKKVTQSLLGLDKTTKGKGGFGIGGRIAAASERTNASLARMRGSVVDATVGFYALTNAIGGPVRAAMNFESAMADVRKVVDFPTPDGFEKFKASLLDLSKQVPLSVNGLAKIAAAAGQAGIKADDLVKFTEAAAKVGVAFDMSADQTGDALAKMMTGLGLDIDQVVSLADAMNHLSNQQASSAADILDVVRRVGAQAKLYGFTAEQTAAFASAMLSAGAESEVAATSFRNMGMALTRGASATKKQRDAFKKLGLDAGTVAKDMQEHAVDTTIDVLERLSKLPKSQQGAIASNLFGNEARALGPLLTNLKLVKNSIGMVSDEADYAGSAFKEYEARSKTFANSLALFQNRFEGFKVVIGDALIPALNDLMDKIAPVVDKLTQFASAHPGITRNVIAAAAAVVSFKIAVTGLKFVGLLGKAGALSLLAAGFKTVGRAAKFAKESAGGMIALQKSLAAMEGLKLTGPQAFFQGLKGIALGIPGIAAIGEALAAIGTAAAAISLPAWGAIAAAVGLVAAGGFLVWKYWDRISSVFSGVAWRIGQELQPKLEGLQPFLAPIGDAARAIGDGFGWAGKKLSEFTGWLGQFFQQEALTDEQKVYWTAGGYELADAMINSIKAAFAGLIDWFKGLPGKILGAIGPIDLSPLIKLPDVGAMAQQAAGGAVSNFQTGWNALTGGGDQQSGHRATGGPVWPGGSFLVGERGEPEIFTPKSAGTVTPASKTAGVTFNMPITINGAVGDAREIARQVRREIEDGVDRLLRGAFSDSEAWDQ